MQTPSCLDTSEQTLKKKKFLKASEKKHVSYKGMIRLLDSNHRCQMPENNARLCVSSPHWGKTTVFLCAVLSYIITWVFSPKVTTHKPEWKPTLLEEDFGFRREEGRSKEHADMRLTQGSSNCEKHLQQLCRLSINPLDSHSLFGHFGFYAPPLRHGSPCVWGMQPRSPSAYYGCHIALSSSFLEYFTLSGLMRMSLPSLRTIHAIFFHFHFSW